MKIVDYNEFIETPKYTIYSEYYDCNICDIHCKGDVINNKSDWFYSQLTNNLEYNSDVYSEAFLEMENGKSIDIDVTTIQRDGMYDNDRRFIIYEKNDIIELIEKLNFSLLEAYDKR